MLRALWAGRRTIFMTMVVSTILSVAYALMATEWYQAEVVLIPVSKKSISGGLGQLSSLASIAGIELPGADSGEPLAVLKSRDFAREFIEEKNLLPQFFNHRWDFITGLFAGANKRGKDYRDGVKYFQEKICSITEDKKSGTIILRIEWKDPVVAADWANEMVKKLNDRMRTEAIEESQISIEYLQREMLATSVVTLQQSIGRVLENDMQKMALARAKEQFALKVVDRASPPKFRSWPLRTFLVLSAALLGFLLGAGLVLLRKS